MTERNRPPEQDEDLYQQKLPNPEELNERQLSESDGFRGWFDAIPANTSKAAWVKSEPLPSEEPEQSHGMPSYEGPDKGDNL